MSTPANSTFVKDEPLSDDQGPIPTFKPLAVDPETGRIIPLSADERRERSEALARALDALARITDESDTDETWEEVFRGIDEARPHRKLFEGMY